MTVQNNTSKANTELQDTINKLNSSIFEYSEKTIDYGAKLMADQATGMMIQDLQLFMKGFEQVSLIALAKLANNILTYGSYYGPQQGEEPLNTLNKSDQTDHDAIHSNLSESDALNGLFQIVCEYGEAKSKIWSLINNTYTHKADTNSTSSSESNSTNKTPNNKVNI